MEFTMGHTGLSRDERPIQSAIGDRGNFSVGSGGITKITPYDENGEQAYVPWLAIWKADAVMFRCPARDMTISYEIW